MTRQRDFKQLVRERIAQTGERYATARAHVLAQVPADAAPPAVPGLLPGVTRFGGAQGDTAVLAHLLQHAGVPRSEAMVTGLCGGIGFLYAVFEYAGHPPMVTLVARSNSLPDQFVAAGLARAGARYAVHETGNAAAAQRHLDAALAAGSPAMCTVDMASLPYTGMPAQWQGMAPHVVGVVGRDGDDVWLDDRSASPMRVSLAELAAARARYKKGKHRLVTIDGVESGFDVAAALREAVASTVIAFFESPYKGFASNFGFAGLTKFQRLLIDTRDAKGWPTLFAQGPNACIGLHRVYECVQHDYTAPDAGRPLYAAFLTEAAAIAGEQRWLDAADRFAASGRLWAKLTAAIVDCGDPALRRLCALTEHRAELLDGDASAQERAQLWRDRDEIPPATTLDAATCRDLYQRLAQWVGQIVELERGAVESLAAP